METKPQVEKKTLKTLEYHLYQVIIFKNYSVLIWQFGWARPAPTQTRLARPVRPGTRFKVVWRMHEIVYLPYFHNLIRMQELMLSYIYSDVVVLSKFIYGYV